MADDRRSITTVLRAETGQYERSMDSAAKATSKVGDAAGKAGKQTDGLGKSGKGIADSLDGSSKRATSRLDQMAASVGKNEQAWRTVGRTLTIAGGAVTAFGAAALKTGIEYNTLQQTSRAALTSLLGSAEAANAQMDKLDEFAKSSPFAKSTFISAQQQMLAFGIETQKVIPYLDAVQNAVAAAGGSNADIEGIVATMSKIQSSSKLTAQDLNEFGNRGVNAAELIGEQMGMTGAQVRDSITKGSLDATAALDALAAGMSDRFDGAADNVKNTFAGAIDRVKAAWRDFSSELAAPLVDPEGGGALVDMLNGIADAMRGFENLPDPIKKLATNLGLFGGAAAAAAGGLILFVPKVLETISAFKDLAAANPKFAGALGGIAKSAGLAAAALTVASLASAALDRDITGASAANLEDQLRGVADAADLAAVGFNGMDDSFVGLIKGTEQTRDLADAFDRITDPSAWQKFDDWSANIFGRTTDVDRMTEQFGTLGEALASIYESNPARAAELFNGVLAETGATTDELMGLMPAYAEALDAAKNAQSAAADSAEGMASAQQVLAAALESSDPAIAGLAETYKGLIDGADKAGSSFLDLSDDLGKAEFSLDGWLKKLENQAEATQKWADNIQKLAKRGASVDLLQGLIDQGPAAAQAVNALANGTEEDMKRAEDAIGGATSATGGLQDALSQEFVLQLNTDAAKRQGKSTEDYIAGLQATIEVTGNTVPAQEDGESAKAYISRLLAVMGVDANGNPARKEGESAKAYISRLKSYIDIMGKSAPARREGESAEHYISRLESTIGIDGNNSDAKAKGKEAQNDIDGRDATIDVYANTSSAKATVGSWLSSIPRTITTTVNQFVKKHPAAAAKAMGGKAGGGAIYGPGSGTSDDVPIMASNGEHVLTADDVQAMGGQGAVYGFRSALHRGDAEGFASGGAVGSAERALSAAARRRKHLQNQVRAANKAVKNAEKADRRADKTKSNKDDVAARRRLSAATKRQRALQNRLDKARNAERDQRSRLSTLREERSDLRVDVRRGNLRASATSGLSGAYSVVDQMRDLAGSGNLTRGQARSLSKSAGYSETRMRKLYKQAASLEKQLDKAKSKFDDLLSIRESVKSGLVGGFSLGDVTNPWTGTAKGTTGKDYLASAKAYAAQMKTFAAKLKALQKKGYPGAVLQEVAAMGPEAGIPAADALLSLNTKDTKAFKSAYSSIGTYATQAGNTVTEGFYKGGVLAAKGLVKGLQSQQKNVNSAIAKMAKAMEKALKRALGIKSPSTVFRDLGLQTGAGMVAGLQASVGDVARASEQLAHIPGAVAPSVYANPPKASAQQVTAVVDKGAMADAMNGVKMTLLVDGKPIEAIAQTTVDRNLVAVGTSLRGGRR